jgi:multicomponent Na+:H+ antiporter subunit C
MEVFYKTFIANFNYWIYVILMMIGLFAMIAKNNLIKKLVGMCVFQTAIILFYVSIGVKQDARIPILSKDQVPHAGHYATENHERPYIDTKRVTNPIPHVLMLTAIVVGVSTLGVGLAIAQKVHLHYGTLEEDEILSKIHLGDDG